MTKTEAKSLHYFSWNEIAATGADPKDVNSILMEHMDALRDLGQCPIRLIRNGLTTGKHAAKEHPSGLACDWYWAPGRGKKKPTKNQTVQLALDVGFTGIGVYNTAFHCDLRGSTKLWTRKNGVYLPLVEG